MQPINLIGGFYKDDALPWSVQDTVNLLPVAAEVDGARTPTKLRTPPGLRPFVNIGDGPDYAIRGMHDVEGALYVVAGSRLYRISNTGVAIPCGTIPGVGRVSMAHNQITGGNELLVVNGDAGYVWNTVTETFARVSDEGYPGAFIADYIDSYLAQVEPFGRFWFHSDLADAMSYNTLDRAESEASPDRIVSLLSAHLEVWVFGERTIEVFENTGAGTGTFQNKRVALEKGCAGRYTPAKLDNGIFWLGNDGVVYRANGYQPQRISTHAIERAIADSDWSQAFAFTWSDRGHAVYYLTFPDGQTWGYDVSSGLWHRRATYHPQHDVARRWRLNDLVYSNRQWIGGDYRDGKLYVLDWDYALEGEGDPLVRERVAQVVHADQRRISVNEVELVMETGGDTVAGVEFPYQPKGPKIAGDAPDGAITLPYSSYAYTVQPGDAPITSIRIVSGSLPPGSNLSALGVIGAFTPTAVGRYPFVVRVTDANGLWDEISDTIEISTLWYARAYGVGAGGDIIRGFGDSWDHPILISPDRGTGALILASPTTLLVWSAQGMALTKDRGVTWEGVSPVPTSPQNGYRGVWANGKFWIPAFFQLYASPTGESGTWVSHPGNGDLPMTVVFADNYGVRGGRYAVVRTTTDGGETWGPTQQLFPPPDRDFEASATDGRRITLAGTDLAAKTTLNGTTWADVSIPFTPSQGDGNLSIAGLACDRNAGVWVAATRRSDAGPRGEFARSTNGVDWELLEFVAGSNINDLKCFFGMFVAVGDNGRIFTSADGVAWTEHASQAGDSQLTSVTAVPEE